MMDSLSRKQELAKPVSTLCYNGAGLRINYLLYWLMPQLLVSVIEIDDVKTLNIKNDETALTLSFWLWPGCYGDMILTLSLIYHQILKRKLETK